MTVIQTLLAEPALARLGWVLLHFVWQGAAVAVLLAAALLALRGASAPARYVTCCAAMALIACLPVCTYFALGARPAPSFDQMPSTATAAFPAVQVTIAATPEAHRTVTAAHALLLPQIAAFLWMAGVMLLATWRIGGWVLLWQTVRRAMDVNSELLQRINAMAERLKLRRKFRVLESARVTVPAVVGWLKPAVLLPVSALSGIGLAEVEAILAHELAHIRRHDYLVNLLQTAIETALFYHPAVWWVSSRIREERENCCDDIAAEACGDKLLYAAALARVEELRSWPAPLAVGAAGGSLLRRIRRLLQKPQSICMSAPTSATALLVMLAFVILPLWAMKSHAQTSAVQRAGATTQPATGKANEAKNSQVQPQDLVPTKEDYRIVPNDLLSVTITDLAGPGKETVRETRVTDAGYISLPYLGRVKAEGETAMELEKSIAKAFLEANLVANAQVSVSVVEARGLAFTVLGDVEAQNVYSITSPDMRLLDALAMARLAARGGIVLVIRPIPEKKNESRVIAVPLDQLLAGDLHYNLVVRPHDVIRVIGPASPAR